MVIRLFILNKDNHCVAVKSDGSYECLSGGDLYMEPIDEAVKRIADEYLGVQLDSDRLNLVRRESSTVVEKHGCRVDAVATYVYECSGDEICLDDSDFTWIPVGVTLNMLCDDSKYAEAYYLSEACSVVE